MNPVFKPGAEPIDLAVRGAERQALAGYIPTGLTYLDDRLLGLMNSDLMLIGAESGSGKTTLAQIMAKLAAEADKRPTFIALEAYKGEVADRYVYREMARIAWDQQLRDRRRFTFRRWLAGECKSIENRVREQAEANIAPWVKNVRVLYRGQRFTHEDITRELLAEQNNTDFFVLDHVHYVDTDDPNENRALKEITQALRNAALVTNKPVVAVAHLRKRPGFEKTRRLVPVKDDFHGSSDLIKIATQIVILAPALQPLHDNVGRRNHDKAATYVRLDKERGDGTSDRWVAVMSFDKRTSTYETGYYLHELNLAGDEATLVSPDDLPVWATHALNRTN